MCVQLQLSQGNDFMVAYRGISHFCVACMQHWLASQADIFQKSRQAPWIHSWVGNLPSTVYLPASDAKCPLHSVVCVGDSPTIMTIVVNVCVFCSISCDSVVSFHFQQSQSD